MNIDKLETSYTIDICIHDNSSTGWTKLKTYKATKTFPGDTVQDIGHLVNEFFEKKEQLFLDGGFKLKLYTSASYHHKDIYFCGPDEMIPGITGHYTTDLLFTVKWSSSDKEESYFLDGIEEECELISNKQLFEEILDSLC